MASDEDRDQREQVRLLLGKINDAWLKRRPEEIAEALAGCFHDDIVVLGPGFQEIARGSAACVKSYEDFARQAAVRKCQLSEPDVHVAGDTAVAVYAWEMTYEMGGQDYQESGHDLFVLARRAGGKWQAVWRALLPSAAA
ncbi:MAG TPA: nuclear transport factor 2 family protein [Bryobacterales bacterium]|nr:nuclear transport factor 2 family protein [Bryobacterales bacterium]